MWANQKGEQVGVLFGNYPSSPNSRWSIDSNGKLRILWHNGQINLTGSTDLRDNTWHHIALVRDISNSKFYAYIDGANEIITGHDSAGDNETFTATHRIGADNSPNPNNFHGMIDELQIWNIALTPTMIVESLVQQYTYLMPPANNPGLIANWHMDDGSGTVATDVGVNGIHGTLNNMEDSSAWVDSSVPISFATDEDMSFMAALMNPESTPQDIRDAFGGAYFGIAHQQAPAYETMFDKLSAGEAPLAFNCSAGKDRTGIAAALLLTVLGVPRETIVHDYQLSDDYVDYMAEFMDEEAKAKMLEENPSYAFFLQMPPEKVEPIMATYPEYIERFFADIEAEYGSVDAFLKEVINVTDDEMAAIRRQYLKS